MLLAGSACVVNGRLRYTGTGAARRAPLCVVSRVGFSVLHTSSACASAVRHLAFDPPPLLRPPRSLRQAGLHAGWVFRAVAFVPRHRVSYSRAVAKNFPNQLYYGDNLDVLGRHVADESVH